MKNHFSVGERYIGKNNKEIFSVMSIEYPGSILQKGVFYKAVEYPTIRFLHEKTGKIIEYGLSAAENLLFEKLK